MELVTVTTHTGKEVQVPKELWESKRVGSMRAYAVETGQATWEEVNPPESRFDFDTSPTPSGIMENLAVSAGRQVSTTGSNIRQLFNELIGNDTAAQKEIGKQAEVDRLAQPAREEFPVSSFIGEALPSFAIPGGPGVQVGAGIAEGALAGDTGSERSLGGAIGGTLGFAGQKLGDHVGQVLNRRFQEATGNPKSAALGDLHRAGIPVSVASRTRDPLARLSEDIKGIVTNSTNPLEGSQTRRLNRLALRSVGENGTRVTRDALGKAHTRIGGVFENVANDVESIRFSDALIDRLNQAADNVADVETQGASIRRQYDRVLDAATGGTLTGKQYNQIRNRLGKASRSAWTNGDELAAETADEVMDIVDDAMAETSPQIAEALTEARRQWKMLRVLRRARSINPEGDINQQSLLNAFDRVYPGAQVGKFPSGPEGELGRVLAAFQEVVRPRTTSRTAENAVRFGIPASAVTAGLAGANPISIIGGLATLGAGLSGGGTGGLFGGGTARGLLPSLLQQEQQEQSQ